MSSHQHPPRARPPRRATDCTTMCCEHPAPVPSCARPRSCRRMRDAPWGLVGHFADTFTCGSRERLQTTDQVHAATRMTSHALTTASRIGGVLGRSHPLVDSDMRATRRAWPACPRATPGHVHLIRRNFFDARPSWSPPCRGTHPPGGHAGVCLACMCHDVAMPS